MQPHQQRVLDEARDLAEKVARLTSFFHTSVFAAIDQAERERLLKQVKHMAGYLEVLMERIAAFPH